MRCSQLLAAAAPMLLLLLLAAAVGGAMAQEALPAPSHTAGARLFPTTATMKTLAAAAKLSGAGVDFSTRAQAQAASKSIELNPAVLRALSGPPNKVLTGPTAASSQAASALGVNPLMPSVPADTMATSNDLPAGANVVTEAGPVGLVDGSTGGRKLLQPNDVTASNVCTLSPYSVISSSSLNTYPYNTVVRIVINWFRTVNGVRQNGPSTVCTATALSNIILVTASHCVASSPNPAFPNRYVDAYYGWDGSRATIGIRTSRCVSWWNDFTTSRPDNAIVVLSSAMNLPRYRSYNFVANVSPRTAVNMFQLGYAGADEQSCIGSYAQLYSAINAGDINLRSGTSIGRCYTVPEIWTSASQAKGQSGACLVHNNLAAGACVGTAAHDCEGTACVRTCPNAWGGFQAAFPISSLWASCGL